MAPYPHQERLVDLPAQPADYDAPVTITAGELWRLQYCQDRWDIAVTALQDAAHQPSARGLARLGEDVIADFLPKLVAEHARLKALVGTIRALIVPG
jgi:hypothetical protein